MPALHGLSLHIRLMASSLTLMVLAFKILAVVAKRQCKHEGTIGSMQMYKHASNSFSPHLFYHHSKLHNFLPYYLSNYYCACLMLINGT